MESYVIDFDKLGMQDVEIVGGKNASLGEMISKLSTLGVAVPGEVGVASQQADGVDDVVLAVRARKHHDGGAHAVASSKVTV